ncbi:MAG: nucleotide exchange factor GrpE [Dehalococcoidia bacterium]|nr:nucleotide exchange factor GrpE [Dehalococcoidia bacterium]
MGHPGERERAEEQAAGDVADSASGNAEESRKAPSGLPSGAALTAEEQLRAELEEARQERDQFRALAQRTQADFVNFRRRMEAEREEIQKAAGDQLLLKLFPLLDDLERALQAAPEGDQPWLVGIRLIGKKANALLGEIGVQTVEPLGKPLDPWEHEVVAYHETDEHPEGQVIAVVARGYRLHGKVLRPARVVVAKARPQAPAAGSERASNGEG